MSVIDQLVLPQNFSQETAINWANQPESGLVDQREVGFREGDEGALAYIDEEWLLMTNALRALWLYLNDSDRKRITVLSHLRGGVNAHH